MKYLLSFFVVFMAFGGVVFGIDWERDNLIKNTQQKTIAQLIPLNQQQALVIMMDGSVWRSEIGGEPKLFVGNTINIENFNQPVVGHNFSWVYGYYQGFDEYWREIRKSSRLLLLEGAIGLEEIPYSSYKENFFIMEIVHEGEGEILLLNNGSILVMPSQHAGNSIGDQLTLQVMKNGSTAYLTRQLDEEGQTVLIPMHRASSNSFIAH